MISIGEASKECGVGIETIRYYEREGVVPKPGRLDNGRRVYSKSDVSRLRFVKRCRNLGFAIPDIRNLQHLAFERSNSCVEAAKIGERNLEQVRQKISELAKMEKALSQLVSRCKEAPERCPMLDSLLLD